MRRRGIGFLAAALIPVILAVIIAILEGVFQTSITELILGAIGGEQVVIDSLLKVPTSSTPRLMNVTVWPLMIDAYDKMRAFGVLVLAIGLFLAALSFAFENIKLLPEKWSLSIVRTSFWAFIMIMIFPDLWTAGGELINYLSLPDNKVILSGGEITTIAKQLSLGNALGNLLNFNELGQSILAAIIGIAMLILSIATLITAVALGGLRILLIVMAFLLFPITVALSMIPFVSKIIRHVNEVLTGVLLSPLLSAGALYAGASILNSIGEGASPLLPPLIAYATLVLASMAPVILIPLLGTIYGSVKSGIDMAVSAATAAVIGGITAASGYAGALGSLGGGGGIAAGAIQGLNTAQIIAGQTGVGGGLQRSSVVQNAKQAVGSYTGFGAGAKPIKPSLKTRLKYHAKYLPLAVLSGALHGFTGKMIGIKADPKALGSRIGSRAAANIAEITALESMSGEAGEALVFAALVDHNVNPDWEAGRLLERWHGGTLSDNDFLRSMRMLGVRLNKQSLPGIRRALDRTMRGEKPSSIASEIYGRVGAMLRREGKRVFVPRGDYAFYAARKDMLREKALTTYSDFSEAQKAAIKERLLTAGMPENVVSEVVNNKDYLQVLLSTGDDVMNYNHVRIESDDYANDFIEAVGIKKTHAKFEADDTYLKIMSMSDEDVGRGFSALLLGDKVNIGGAEVDTGNLMNIDYGDMGRYAKKIISDYYEAAKQADAMAKEAKSRGMENEAIKYEDEAYRNYAKVIAIGLPTFDKDKRIVADEKAGIVTFNDRLDQFYHAMNRVAGWRVSEKRGRGSAKKLYNIIMKANEERINGINDIKLVFGDREHIYRGMAILAKSHDLVKHEGVWKEFSKAVRGYAVKEFGEEGKDLPEFMKHLMEMEKKNLHTSALGRKEHMEERHGAKYRDPRIFSDVSSMIGKKKKS